MLRGPLGSTVTQMTSPLGVSGGAATWYAGAYAAYDAKNAASYAASLLDLTGNGRHATTGVQPGHTPGVGWIFNGTSHYIDTGVTPVNNQTWSMIIKFSSVLDDDGFLCGILIAGGRFNLIPKNGGARSYQSGNQFFSPGAAVLSGTMAFAGRACYLNGLPDGTIPVGTSLSTGSIFIGAVRAGGGATLFCAATVSSWAIYNTTRSDAQMLATSASMP